jgi:multiple sugar transport system substrate-binding protein
MQRPGIKLISVTTILLVILLSSRVASPIANAQSATMAATAAFTQNFSGTQLTLLRWAGDPWEKATRDAAASFSSATGAQVTIDAIPYENLREKQVLELSSKSGAYDIVYVHPGWFGEYAKSGYLAPIDDYMADPSLNPPGFSKDLFVPSILAQGNYQGKQYCIQDFVSTILLAYRTDVFAANNLKPPQSWDDVLAAAKVLNGKDGMAGIALPGKRTGAVADLLSTMLVDEGTWYFDDNGKPALDAAKAEDAVTFYANLGKYAPTGLLNAHYDEATTAAAQGKAAQLISLSTTLAWLDDPARSSTVGKWAYVPLKYKGNPGGELIYWNWCVTADSKNPKAAYSFMRQLTNGETQAKVAVSAFTGGATKDFYTNKELATKLPFLSALNEALTNAKPQPSLTNWPKIQDAVELAVQNTISGDKTPKQAVAAINAILTEVLGK